MADQFDKLQAAREPSVTQGIALALQGFGAGVGGQLPQFQQSLQNRADRRQALTLERKQAFAQDLLGTKNLIDSGDLQGGANLLSGRIEMINQLGGDPSETMGLLQSIQSAQTPEELQAISGDLGQLVNRSVAAGFLEAPASQQAKFVGTPVRVQRDGETFLSGIVQNTDGSFSRQDVALDGELVSTLGETAGEQTGRIVGEAGGKAQAIAGVELETAPGIAGAVEAEKGKAQIKTEDVKQVSKINNSRIAELNQGGKARASSTKKAKQFLRAIRDGKAFTGATRSAASFVPGVFTSQASFDEKFNAFAEVAARQKLKASGEIRPTDADVEGMKRAIFGIGRDEEVNIQLLEEFISDQDDADDELDDLLSAKKRGDIGSFTRTVDLKTLNDDDLLGF